MTNMFFIIQRMGKNIQIIKTECTIGHRTLYTILLIISFSKYPTEAVLHHSVAIDLKLFNSILIYL